MSYGNVFNSVLDLCIMKPKSISIIIPIYNEAPTTEILLEKIDKLDIGLKKEIIIIESNSTDGTRDIVKNFEKKKKIPG